MKCRIITLSAACLILASAFVVTVLAGDVDLPKINRMTLDNGLEVLALEHHEQPVVAMRLVMRGGMSYDTPDKAGLANFTAGLLRQGTTTRDANQISEEIDFVGGSLSAGADLDATYATCRVLTKHTAVGIDLLADIVINPTFAEDEVERLRKQIIAGIMQSKDDPNSVVSEMYDKKLFGDHPYGLPSVGNLETATEITRDDIVAFHEKYYMPNNSFLIIVGDIKPKEIFTMVKEKFSTWEKGVIPELNLPEPPAVNGYSIILINKPDATQSNIKFGHLGVSRSNPDIFAVRVMNYIVGGGGFVSRLVKDIRAEQGLTYDINSQFAYNRDIGDFTVTTYTKNESTADAIKSTIDLLKEVRSNGLTEKEVDECHSFYSGYFPLVFETPSQIALQLQTAELYNLGEKYLTTYISNINGVDVKKASEAARKYIDPDNMLFVVVGKAEEIQAGLEEIGPVTVYELSDL
jgi:zinc protease